MTTAMVSMNPVVNHCAVVAVMERSVIRRGSATLMIVSLRIITKEDTTRMPMSRPAPGGSSEVPVWLFDESIASVCMSVDDPSGNCGRSGC